ncbi:MAG: hypothetical protein ACFFAH_00995 [Promethearchaeota archaeon]
MLIYILTFIVIFFIVIFISLFCLFKKNLIVDNAYLIIPAICIGLWALYSHLIQDPDNIFTWDVDVVYVAGKKALTDPANIYDVPTFQYMPNFTIFIAIILSIFPYSLAYPILFLYNYLWAILAIREFNKILILKEVSKKIHRFMFLMIFSNGFWVYFQFYLVQTKFFVLLILLYIIRRELQFNIEQKEKDLKYYLINFNLLILAAGTAPQCILYLLLYIFQDVRYNEIFKKENFKKYIIAAGFFLIQNIFFIIFPHQIFEFLARFQHMSEEKRIRMSLIYLREWVDISKRLSIILNILSLIALFIIIAFLIYKNHLEIQEKFGWLSLAFILIGFWFHQSAPAIIFFSLILLLFVPHLNQDVKGFEFIKSNRILLTGILSILIISFLAYEYGFVMVLFIPRPKELILVLLLDLRWIIFFSIMIISLILIKLNLEKVNNNLIG